VELESVLMKHPDVLDAAVIGVPDDVAGDLPRALVVPRNPDVDPQDIVKFVHGRPYRSSFILNTSLF